jgi:hypothetical protein
LFESYNLIHKTTSLLLIIGYSGRKSSLVFNAGIPGFSSA